jgi:cell division transport system permease protein
MIQLIRVLQAGLRNFMRNMWLSTAATAVMTITLTIIVISFISNSALTSTIKGVTDKIDISIYLKDSVTPAQRDAFQTSLKSQENVESIRYLSKDDALALYKEENKNNPTLIKGLEFAGNPLPASFRIKAKDPKKLDGILAVTQRNEYKGLLDTDRQSTYQGENKETINRIVRFSNFFKTAGLVASVIFVIISTLIIFNTIRMAIFTRRDEIEIMKLVGATKWFIRGPFIFEAALYGIIAAAIAVTLSYALLLGGASKLGSYINFQSTIDFFQHYPLLVIGGELVIGICIGAFSSMLAMSRYLKL